MAETGYWPNPADPTYRPPTVPVALGGEPGADFLTDIIVESKSYPDARSLKSVVFNNNEGGTRYVVIRTGPNNGTAEPADHDDEGPEDIAAFWPSLIDIITATDGQDPPPFLEYDEAISTPMGFTIFIVDALPTVSMNVLPAMTGQSSVTVQYS